MSAGGAGASGASTASSSGGGAGWAQMMSQIGGAMMKSNQNGGQESDTAAMVKALTGNQTPGVLEGQANKAGMQEFMRSMGQYLMSAPAGNTLGALGGGLQKGMQAAQLGNFRYQMRPDIQELSKGNGDMYRAAKAEMMQTPKPESAYPVMNIEQTINPGILELLMRRREDY